MINCQLFTVAWNLWCHKRVAPKTLPWQQLQQLLRRQATLVPFRSLEWLGSQRALCPGLQPIAEGPHASRSSHR